MDFRCRVASPGGEIVEGIYSAESETRLRHDLEDKGLYILSLRPKVAVGGLPLRFGRRERIATREFVVFNQELATLLKAGMPLVQSLDLLRQRVASPVFRRVLNDVYEQVKAGGSISDAFGAHGALIPGVYTASLVAGERSGSLDTVLRRFVEHTKIVATVRQKTISALIYPAILITLAVVLVAIIVLRVVPAFTDFYESFGAELPMITQMIIAVSETIRSQWWLLLGGFGAAVALGTTWLRNPSQKVRFDRFLLGVPVVGDIAARFSTSQMARTIATLLGGGVPLVDSLQTASRSIGNRFMAQQLDVVRARVREGESFAAALNARGVFPEVAVKMAEVGESTGALQEMLNTVADFYDEEIATDLERFVSLVEPVLLVVMGVVIAALLLALYMPLLQLSSVLG
jgi:type IV pilus assembly protein PilC